MQDAVARKALAQSGRRVAADLDARSFLLEWVERYQGSGRRGFREETRVEYREDLVRRILPLLPRGLRLRDLSPLVASQVCAGLCAAPNGRGGVLSDSSVRKYMAVLSAAMSTAVAEGLVASNPCRDVQLPRREHVVPERPRALTVSELEGLMTVLRGRPGEAADHVSFLVSSGLRFSEFSGLNVGDWADGVLQVRRRFREGVLGVPKSRHAVRSLSLPVSASRIADAAVDGRELDAPLFRGVRGGRLDRDSYRRNVLRPAGAQAGVPWVGWHSLRHTCASLLFADGANLLRVSRFLGHHSPSFTLDTYVHLLDGEPLCGPSVG